MQYELGLEDYRRVFSEIDSIVDQKVVFTGGEPLLRADLFDLAHLFREFNHNKQIRLCLISNGLLIDNHRAQQIAENFDEVRISLDGSRVINDSMRGYGNFDGAVRAIKNLTKAGIFPGVSITVTATNLPYLADFLSFLVEDMLITDIHLAPFRPFGRGIEHKELISSWKDAQLIVTEFWQKKFGSLTLENEPETGVKTGCHNCGVGGYLNIHPNGDVYPCHVLSVPEFYLGNVCQNNLSAMINSSPLLAKLSHLDFKEMAAKNAFMKEVFDEAICLGEIYRDAPKEVRELIELS